MQFRQGTQHIKAVKCPFIHIEQYGCYTIVPGFQKLQYLLLIVRFLARISVLEQFAQAVPFRSRIAHEENCF